MARSLVSIANWGRGLARRSAAFAAAAVFSMAQAGGAVAEEQPDDIYLALVKDPKKVVVIFAFSDSTQDGYTPKTAMALYPRPEYQPEGQWEVEQGCAINLEFPTGIPVEFRDNPVYGPSSEVPAIDPVMLPTYMANEVGNLMMEYGFAEGERDFAQHFNCTGYLWAELLRRTPQEWGTILREQYERQKQEGE